MMGGFRLSDCANYAKKTPEKFFVCFWQPVVSNDGGWAKRGVNGRRKGFYNRFSGKSITVI